MMTRDQISKQIVEKGTLPGVKLFILKTPIKQVVTIAGSLLGGEYFGPGTNPAIAEIAAEMLDQGTKNYSKEKLHELIESRGASIDFAASTFRVDIKAKCLAEDTKFIIKTIAEILRHPTFPQKELPVIKKRLIGQYRELNNDTRSRAFRRMCQKIFPKNHPNYANSNETIIKAVEKTTINDVRHFYDKNYGLGNMNLVFVGDVNEKNIAKSVAESFRGWKKSPLKILAVKPVYNTKQTEEKIRLKEKTSVDFVLGAPIGIDSKHPLYYPLFLGNFILGSNFTARLMQELREKRGLTYGSYSFIRGARDGVDGFFYAWGTFAPTLLEKGKKMLLMEIKKWLAKGISEKELGQKKKAIIGDYEVGLATTRGLAGVILTNAEQGRSKEFIDEYPKVIEKITLTQVNSAIKKHLSEKKFVAVAAGTI